jgi:hypothetical protein
MNRQLKQFGLGLILGAQALLYQNCSDAKFTNVESANLNAKSCQTNLIDSTRPMKILFLVDASGSNNMNGTSPGTDPTKKWRLEAINSLVNRYGTKNNFFFGLVTFQDTSAKAQLRSPAGDGYFSNVQSEVQTGITNFQNNADANNTPYKAALTMAKAMIQQDLKDNASQDAFYSIVMVSDGMPSDYKTANDVIPDVAAITDLAPGRITVNSVFYYNTDAQKATNTDILKNIATLGKGSFITANSNESINLNDTIKVPQEVCN